MEALLGAQDGARTGQDVQGAVGENQVDDSRHVHGRYQRECSEGESIFHKCTLQKTQGREVLKEG